PSRVDVPLLPRADRPVDGVDPGLPSFVKDGLVLFVADRPHSVHSAHVVYAVHAFAPPGAATLAVPIIEFRVTSAASSCSVMFPVPAGRSGKTRYRISAVLSHTRISTSSASSVPNSRRTPRGSITARDRYGADLYQTGGKPSTGHG